ncbi:MAG TPA: hypothetical protein VMM56_06825 [Planctomycetaceae bacterium]|nr:hypothetical protein [Planctomycetaceae bacterium]
MRRGDNVFTDHLAGRSTIQRGPEFLLVVSIVPLCWLLMMLVHEFGHVLGAWATGGTVERVIWHPLAFSRTDVAPNPAPLIVVWAGPLLGGLLPFAAWVMLYRFPWAFVLRFFAGFCLIANGGYIGLGSFDRLGDCGPMLSHGSPMWVLWVFGATYAAAGLCLWHRLGPKFGLGNEPEPVSRNLARIVAGLAALVVICGFVFGRLE